jgi:hypothetical protein
MHKKVETRMIRVKLLAALKEQRDWKIENSNRIHRSDGLWVERISGEHSTTFSIGSADIGVPQAYIEADSELIAAYTHVVDLGIGTDPARRPILGLLGIEIP